MWLKKPIRRWPTPPQHGRHQLQVIVVHHTVAPGQPARRQQALTST
jgi:hypothetical protein